MLDYAETGQCSASAPQSVQSRSPMRFQDPEIINSNPVWENYLNMSVQSATQNKHCLYDLFEKKKKKKKGPPLQKKKKKKNKTAQQNTQSNQTGTRPIKKKKKTQEQQTTQHIEPQKTHNHT
eukprot:TRINITY_DN15293_c0_g1_i2.p2 TRINITY_DN15293_c0_g1~~TRINITY_DN15293_c0_g1_i2.p2  ORF type:complete len:122 (-),score=25.57 TRINITY_DN15293_c0_g1_i2:3-368(-)